MNIYGYSRQHGLIEVKNPQEFDIGERYIIRNYASLGEFRGVEQQYIFEEYTKDYIVLVLTGDYKRKFAVGTNDCVRDDFLETQAARIVLEKGDLINIVYCDNDERSPKDIVTLKIIGSDKIGNRLDVIVQCIDKFDTITKPEWATELVMHIAETYHSRHIPVQLIRKLAYNNSRTIKYGLFTRNSKGELTLERNGVTYILNNNSAAHIDRKGQQVQEGLYRFFYSNRFENSPIIFVDGILIDNEYTNFDINEYMNSKKTTIDVRRSVRRIVTKNGNDFIGLLQNNGGVKIVIKLGNDYKLIHLTPSEIESIMSVDTIADTV